MEVFSQARLHRKYWTTDSGCSGFATISAVVVVSSSTTTDNTEDDDDNTMILVAAIVGVVVVIVVLGILVYCCCRDDDEENDAIAKKVPTETTMPVSQNDVLVYCHKKRCDSMPQLSSVRCWTALALVCALSMVPTTSAACAYATNEASNQIYGCCLITSGTLLNEGTPSTYSATPLRKIFAVCQSRWTPGSATIISTIASSREALLESTTLPAALPGQHRASRSSTPLPTD